MYSLKLLWHNYNGTGWSLTFADCSFIEFTPINTKCIFCLIYNLFNRMNHSKFVNYIPSMRMFFFNMQSTTLVPSLTYKTTPHSLLNKSIVDFFLDYTKTPLSDVTSITFCIFRYGIIFFLIMLKIKHFPFFCVSMFDGRDFSFHIF